MRQRQSKSSSLRPTSLRPGWANPPYHRRYPRSLTRSSLRPVFGSVRCRSGLRAIAGRSLQNGVAGQSPATRLFSRYEDTEGFLLAFFLLLAILAINEFVNI